MKILKSHLIILSTFIVSCNNGNTQIEQVSKVQDSTLEKPTISYKTYCNSRFDYCIDYPKDILFPQPEPENGDGCVFKSKEAEEILSVAGSHPFEDDGVDILASRYDSELSGEFEENGNIGRVITYKKLGKSFFVVSGYKNGRIFYNKTIMKGDFIASARLQYSESDKVIYDNVSERIFKSFK